MRKNVYGRHFKRDKNERKALFKSLMSSFILKGRIKTTEEKAKAIRPSIDKLITTAKKNTPASFLSLHKYLYPGAAEKLLKEVTPRFGNRNSGYTRIIRLGRRLTDSASEAIIEWVEMEEVPTPTAVKKTTAKKGLIGKKAVQATKTSKAKTKPKL